MQIYTCLSALNVIAIDFVGFKLLWLSNEGKRVTMMWGLDACF